MNVKVMIFYHWLTIVNRSIEKISLGLSQGTKKFLTNCGMWHHPAATLTVMFVNIQV